MRQFLEEIKNKILVSDGAMGTMLTGGQKLEYCLEYLNIKEPLKVMNVHLQYADAGANIIETNTFGANELSLAKFGLEDKVEEINKAGVRIAKFALAGKDVYLAGAVGPANNNGSFDVYKKQISALAQEGVDLIIIETMSNPQSVINAINAAKSISSNLPVVAQIACYKDFMTKGNVDAETFFRMLNDSKADVLGINCLIGPKEMYPIFEQLRKWTTKPLSIQPNAGELTFSEQDLYSSSDLFERYTKKFAMAGARIIGGCCGTTPRQISTIAKTIQKNNFLEKKQKIKETELIEVTPRLETRLQQMFESKKQFTIIEIDPPHIGKKPNEQIEFAKELYQLGVKVFTIADNPGAVPRMDNLAFASLLLKEIPDAELILHIACRDLSIITAESKISGAEAIGIKNILAITGDRPANGDYDRSISVNNFQSISLLGLLNQKNKGKNALGQQVEQSNLYLGCAFDCGKFRTEKDRIKTKNIAGADFSLTQIIGDVEQIDQLGEFLKEFVPVNCKFYFVPGIYLFRSVGVMDAMQKPPFNVKISAQTTQLMKDCKTPKEQRTFGYELAKKLIFKAKEKFGAIYLIPPATKPDSVINLIKETGIV